VAFQSQLLEVKDHKVLEIEQGQIQTAVLCLVGAKYIASKGKPVV
jgi:hypothetical protein